jgi:hypothetical protein
LIYDSADDFKNGKAFVEINEKCFKIDKMGKRVK